MSRRTSLYVLLALLLSPPLGAEPFLQVEVNLSASWTPSLSPASQERLPMVRSYARAFIYDRLTGDRIYRHIILDHGVFDLNTQKAIFQARLTSEDGYISSGTRDLLGDSDHCYSAVATGHVNDFNLHKTPPRPQACMPPPPEKPEIPEENCPVILDLEMDGFHLSGPEPAVTFDIDADGVLDRISWTQVDEDDAFLCLDRNQNGTIDNGTELFGYATPLLSGEPARLGYRALAELDRPETGGNGNGRIEPGDRLFQSLCVWNDRDRDGVSTPDEIRSAAAAGVASLEFTYRTTEQRDRFGNLFRYVSHLEMNTRPGRTRRWLTYDVIFVGAKP